MIFLCFSLNASHGKSFITWPTKCGPRGEKVNVSQETDCGARNTLISSFMNPKSDKPTLARWSLSFVSPADCGSLKSRLEICFFISPQCRIIHAFSFHKRELSSPNRNEVTGFDVSVWCYPFQKNELALFKWKRFFKILS